MTTWYVRPSGGSYGLENGTSYENAWDGFTNIVWGATGVEAEDTLYVCGIHTQQLTVGHSGDSEGLRITIRGDYVGDTGTINGATTNNILVSSRSYITIDMITVGNNTGSYGVGGGIQLSSSNYIVVRNCTYTNAGGVGGVGIAIYNSTNCTADLNTITNATGYAGVAVNGGPSHVGNVVSNNLIHDCRVDGIYTAGGAGNRLAALTVSGNEIYNCYSGIYFNYHDNSLVYNNYIHDNGTWEQGEGEPYGIGHMCSSNVSYYLNRFYNNGNKAIDISAVGNSEPCNGNKVYYNWFYDNTYGAGRAVHFSTQSDELGVNNNEVYYNIFTGNTSAVSFDAGSSCTGNIVYGNMIYNNGTGLYLEHNDQIVTVKNNIFSANTGYAIAENAADRFTSDTLVHNNNLYYKASGNVVNLVNQTYTLTTVKSTFETTCQNTNPLFIGTSTWSDFRLQSASPAIGTGANLGASYDDALDPDDLTWPPSTLDQDDYGNWEIGAFVYTGDGESPSISPSVSPSSSPSQSPSRSPSLSPSRSPSRSPSTSPSVSSSLSPSVSPSNSPSASPSLGAEYPKFILTDSPYLIASGSNTSSRLDAPPNKDTTFFTAGRIQDDENPTDPIGMNTTLGDTEYCTNGDMELDSDWLEVNSPDTSEQVTNFGYSNDTSWHIADSQPATWAGVRNTAFTSTTNKYYRVSGRVYIVSGAVRVVWVRGVDGMGMNIVWLTTTGSWQYFTYDHMETNGGTSASVAFINNSGVDDVEFYIDDITVKEVINKYTEIEFCIKATDQAVVGEIYEFRVTRGE